MNIFKSLRLLIAVCILAGAMLSAGAADAAAKAKKPKPKEFPIGVEQLVKEEGCRVSVWYKKPFELSPAGSALSAKRADFHLRVNIMAGEDNKVGLKTGELLPGLAVSYSMRKKESGESFTGILKPLEENNKVSYYGTNVKLAGEGVYECEFSFAPEKGSSLSKPLKVSCVFKFIPRKW